MCKRSVEGILRLFLIFLMVMIYLLFLISTSPPTRSDRMKFLMRTRWKTTTSKFGEENAESVKNLKNEIEYIKKNLKKTEENKNLDQKQDAKEKIEELLKKIRERNL